jgi:hypothetical protein
MLAKGPHFPPPETQQLICLFVLFSFYVLHPEGACGRFYKRNRPPPLRASHNKRNPPPPACAVRMSRGMGPPYKVKERSKETKRNEMRRGLDGDVLQARAPPSPLLLCLPYYPFVHFLRMSLVLIHSPIHIASDAGQLQESQQPAFPS